jgi:hypothetical protein
MKKLVALTTLATLVLLTTSCATPTRHLKLMGNDATPGAVDPAITKVTGESCKRNILFVIGLAKDGTMEDAVADALAKAPGANALADIKVTGHRLLTGLYNYRCVEVEGRPVALK